MDYMIKLSEKNARLLYLIGIDNSYNEYLIIITYIQYYHIQSIFWKSWH